MSSFAFFGSIKKYFSDLKILKYKNMGLFEIKRDFVDPELFMSSKLIYDIF